MKVVHKLPMSFEPVVQLVHDRLTGKQTHYEIVVKLVCDGRVDVKNGQRVKVTVEKWKAK